MVPRGLEPRTLRLLAVRSNQLSYKTSWLASTALKTVALRVYFCFLCNEQLDSRINRITWLNSRPLWVGIEFVFGSGVAQDKGLKAGSNENSHCVKKEKYIVRDHCRSLKHSYIICACRESNPGHKHGRLV